MKKAVLRGYKVILLMLLSSLLVSCAGSNMSKNDSSNGGYTSQAETGGWEYGFDGKADFDQGGEIKGQEDSGDNIEESGAGSASGTDGPLYNSNDKIIRKINLSLETQAFDDLIKSVETQINELGGYVETSRLTGRHYNSNNLRYGTIIARIPKETVDGFVSNLGNVANITEKAENVDNVTLQYVDLESRTEALEIEQERLLSLLEKAQDIEVIISLESRLTSVRYELQSLKTQVRTIDNQVDFSTITMNIQEVRLMSVGIDSEESIGDRIARGTKESFYNFKANFADFIVWLVVSLPYLMIWLIIIVVVLLVLRRIRNKLRINKTFKHMNYGDAINHEVKEDAKANNDKK